MEVRSSEEGDRAQNSKRRSLDFNPNKRRGISQSEIYVFHVFTNARTLLSMRTKSLPTIISLDHEFHEHSRLNILLVVLQHHFFVRLIPHLV